MVEMTMMTFDPQVAALRERGLIDDETGFRAILERARPLALVEGSVLTISRDVVPVAVAAARIERRGRSIVLGQMRPEDLGTFVSIDAVKLPDAPAYLAVDVDLGADSRNVRPEEA
jgi:Family of unknown function (DUF5701)